MADVIKLVKDDNRPYIKLTLTQADGVTPLDLSTTTAIKIYFRAAGSTTILSTLMCTFVTDGTDGKIKFNFPGTTLNVPPGGYEGEVEITWSNGEVQTVYEILKFRVRADFD